MTKPKPLTVKEFSIQTGISVATITRAIHSGALVVVVEKSDKKSKGRPRFFIDRASANHFKNNLKKLYSE